MNALSPQIAEALVGSTALSPIGPDAEMIATCAAICENERAYDATGFGHETGSPQEMAAEQERAQIVAQTDALVGRLCDLPCRSLPGIQAMARALAAWDRELMKDGPDRETGEIITSQMVDRILALPSPTADATLIALCTSAEAADDRSWAVWDAVAHLPSGDAGLTAAYDESNRVYNVCRDGMARATVMSPSTPAGWQAKASLALRELAAEDEDALPLVRSVLMQLAGRACS